MGPRCELPTRSPAPLPSEAQRKIQEAEKTYRDLEKNAAADDITPELYFFSVLAEYRQFLEMAKLVDNMLQKRPGDVALLNLKAWVRSQSVPQD